MTTTAPQCEGFKVNELGDGLQFLEGRLPPRLDWNARQFDSIWNLHPQDRHWVTMFGKPTQVARWQQAYGANYSYTGSMNNALPVPSSLRPLLDWARADIDGSLNGLLLNWYDGPNDYIGPHHDSTKGLIADSPIVTVSFGETRVFRLTKGEQRTVRDFPAAQGTVFVMPSKTNKGWKHEIVKSVKNTGRRISVTLRAFNEGVLPADEFFA